MIELTPIHKTKYAEYFINEQHSLLVQHWHNENKTMTEDEYKVDMWNYLKFVKQYNIKRALINTLEFNFPLSPEVQDWIDKNIAAEASKIVRSIAFVLPKDIFAQVSVKQVMEEENALYENIGFFETQQEALKWLLEH